MFPKKDSDSYVKSTGERSTLGAVIGSGGGGGGSFTPDYEHEELIIGTQGDYTYYVPMSKKYIGPGVGYEITTNPESTAFAAKIDIYSITTDNGAITSKTFIKTLVHDGENTYTDDNISITYSNGWIVTLKTTMYDLGTGRTLESPITWTYDTEVDYKWYKPTVN